jgi:hypothetical protein
MPDGASPQGRTLEAKARMWAFDLGGRQHLTLSHLTLWAASITTTATSAFDVLDGITVTYPSAYDDLPTVGPWLAGGTTFLSTARFAHALDSGIVLSGTNNVLENSVVSESAGNGVLLSGENITVTNNLIHDADYMGSYAAPIKIYHPVSSTVPGPDWVTHNTVYNSGRDGIQDDFYWSGNTGATDISYNDVWNYGVLNGDLGAIRDCCAMNGAGMAIHHNWLHDIAPSTCVACTAGAGLYLDNGPRAFTQVHHNVAWNDGNAAYFANSTGSYQAQSITVQNNTAPTTELGFWLGGTTNNPGIVLTNNIFRGGADTSTGSSSVSAFNLSGVDAGYVDAINHDYRLAGGSAAIDAGTVIPGVTDGFVGAAPDQGAYEFGGADWVPGCARSVSLLCVDPHTPGRYVP